MKKEKGNGERRENTSFFYYDEDSPLLQSSPVVFRGRTAVVGWACECLIRQRQAKRERENNGSRATGARVPIVTAD